MTAAIKPSRGETDSLRARPRHRLGRKLLLLLASLVLAAALGEIVLRLFFAGTFHIIQDERNAVFHYDPTLGWFPIPNSGAHLIASRPLTVVHNSRGFRAPEPVKNGKPTIAFLGDSFVWGYDVEAEERFTDKLQAKHPEWNVLNFGVSGYGTDQEYLLLERVFDRYRPRVVFLVFSTETDPDDNSSNERYGGYFKPYYTLQNGRLELHGVPVPRAEKVFLADHDFLSRFYLVRLLTRAWFRVAGPRVLNNPDPTGALILQLQRYVQMKGAALLVGLTAPYPPLQQALDFLRVPYVVLSTTLRYPAFGGHWTPEGHSFVCGKIEEFLRQGKYLEP